MTHRAQKRANPSPSVSVTRPLTARCSHTLTPPPGHRTSTRSTRFRAKSEMQAGSEMALVSASAVDLVDLRQVAGDDSDPGSDSVAIGLHAAKPDLEPVVSGSPFHCGESSAGRRELRITTSMRPSLSRSSNATPRPVSSTRIPSPLASDTLTNFPLPVFRRRMGRAM